jgi:hypothetical protein
MPEDEHPQVQEVFPVQSGDFGEARVTKSRFGEVPPRFGLLATPGEPTGTPAPDAIPPATPSSSGETPAEDNS